MRILEEFWYDNIGKRQASPRIKGRHLEAS